jgi:hypothetical protein
VLPPHLPQQCNCVQITVHWFSDSIFQPDLPTNGVLGKLSLYHDVCLCLNATGTTLIPRAMGRAILFENDTAEEASHEAARCKIEADLIDVSIVFCTLLPIHVPSLRWWDTFDTLGIPTRCQPCPQLACVSRF